MFEEKILLNIYRNYNKDESVAFMNNQIKMLKFELGQYKSDTNEKDHIINSLKIENRKLKGRIREENKSFKLKIKENGGYK